MCYLRNKLLDKNLSCPKPYGGFYIFPCFDYYKEGLLKNGILNSTMLQEELSKRGLFTLAGEYFGVENSYHLRLAVVDFDGQSVWNSINVTAKHIHENTNSRIFFSF